MIWKTCYAENITVQGISTSMTQVLLRHDTNPQLSLVDSCILEDKVQKAKLTSAYTEEIQAGLVNAAALQASLSVLRLKGKAAAALLAVQASLLSVFWITPEIL